MLYANRYIAPAVPLLLAIGALGLDALWGARRATAVQMVRRLAAGGLLLLLLVAVNGKGLIDWAGGNAYRLPGDAQMVRYGLALRQATATDATVAVTWAGALSYYSHRPTIDLLGKCDPVIAASTPPIAAFIPGHNKWDYSYSIGRLRPDVVAQLWFHDAADLLALRSWGYEPVAPGVWVRADSTLVDRATLGEAGKHILVEGAPAGLAGVPEASRLP